MHGNVSNARPVLYVVRVKMMTNFYFVTIAIADIICIAWYHLLKNLQKDRGVVNYVLNVSIKNKEFINVFHFVYKKNSVDSHFRPTFKMLL